MEAFKAILLKIWGSHKKKIIAFLVTIVLGMVASVAGVPGPELKAAICDAPVSAEVSPTGAVAPTGP